MTRINRYRMRVLLLLVCSALAFQNNAWYVVPFLYGSGLADYDLESKISAVFPLPKGQTLRRLLHASWITVLLGSLWIAGWSSTFTPFWGKDPSATWYLVGASFGVVTSIYNLPTVRSFFESPTMQYLGKVSYGVYLLHFPVIDLITIPYIQPLSRSILPNSPGVQLLLVLACEMLTILMLSQIFERYIDRPCIRAAKFVEACFIDQGQAAIELPFTKSKLGP